MYNAAICVGNIPYLPDTDFYAYVHTFVAKLLGKTSLGNAWELKATDPRTELIAANHTKAKVTNARVVVHLDVSQVQTAIEALNLAAFVPDEPHKFMSRLVWAVPVPVGIGKDPRKVASLDISPTMFPAKKVEKGKGTPEHWRAVLASVRDYLRKNGMPTLADRVALQTTATNCRLILPTGENGKVVAAKCPKTFRSTTHLSRTLYVDKKHNVDAASAGPEIDAYVTYVSSSFRTAAMCIDEDKCGQISFTFATKNDLYAAKAHAENTGVHVSIGGHAAVTERDARCLMVFVPEDGGMLFDRNTELLQVQLGLMAACPAFHDHLQTTQMHWLGQARRGHMLEVAFASQLQCLDVYRCLEAGVHDAPGIPKYTPDGATLGYCSFGIKGQKDTNYVVAPLTRQPKAMRHAAYAPSASLTKSINELGKVVMKHPSQSLKDAAADVNAPGHQDAIKTLFDCGYSAQGNEGWWLPDSDQRPELPSSLTATHVRGLTKAIVRSQRRATRSRRR